MSNLVTLHLGSHYPKQYEKESEPERPTLAAEQPGEVHCRVKIRLSKDSSIVQAMQEIAACWRALDHAKAPAWVASTDPMYAAMVSQNYGDIEVREWEPEAGDE